MGRSRAVPHSADEDSGQRSKKKKRASNVENVETVTAAQGKTEGKALYHCNYCNKDISGKVSIKCVIYADFEFCVECFSIGAEVHPHKSNWAEVDEHVETKRKSQCIAHYNAIYMNSPCFPLPDMSHVMGKNGEELLAIASEHGEVKMGYSTPGGVKDESLLPVKIKCMDDPADLLRGSIVSRGWRDFVIVVGLGKVVVGNEFVGGAKRASSLKQSKDEHEGIKVEDVTGRSFGEKKPRTSEDYCILIILKKNFHGKRKTYANAIEYLCDSIQKKSMRSYLEALLKKIENPKDLTRFTAYWISGRVKGPNLPHSLMRIIEKVLCVEQELQSLKQEFWSSDIVYETQAELYELVQDDMDVESYIAKFEQLCLNDDVNDLSEPYKLRWLHGGMELSVTQSVKVDLRIGDLVSNEGTFEEGESSGKAKYSPMPSNGNNEVEEESLNHQQVYEELSGDFPSKWNDSSDEDSSDVLEIDADEYVLKSKYLEEIEDIHSSM
ncbi:OLC1v1016407C1 [Oldenlandia corymbosa var. corymbosa]|uniref:OLC1v1016407C1 n=1 Tax=Oldenlandia corymbosa var. corymbosa TaxID=529605 RepID=A0AAV1E5L8_OLDCO|nr:OLC1v1016407C1 [Oldenlandia corymbosa var. corymbosa]